VPVNTHDLQAHTGWVSALVATNDLLLSASYDTTVRVWSVADCCHVADLVDTHTDYVLRLAAAPAAARLVSAGLRGHLHVWDLEELTSLTALRAGGNEGLLPHDDGSLRGVLKPLSGGCVNSGSIYALDCTPDATLVAFNGPEGCASAWAHHHACVPCAPLRTIPHACHACTPSGRAAAAPTFAMLAAALQSNVLAATRTASTSGLQSPETSPPWAQPLASA
jgi:hypothetical protein